MGRTYRNLDKNKKKAIRDNRKKRNKRSFQDEKQEKKGGQEKDNRYGER